MTLNNLVERIEEHHKLRNVTEKVIALNQSYVILFRRTQKEVLCSQKILDASSL